MFGRAREAVAYTVAWLAMALVSCSHSGLAREGRHALREGRQHLVKSSRSLRLATDVQTERRPPPTGRR